MKCILLILLSIFAVATASADDLPGVVAPEPIVKPMPDPDGQPADDEAIRVGDWDVKISGSVTVDIGAGSQRRTQR